MINVKSKIVMGFGTFDGLHPGHMYFLRQLKELGNEVFIVIATDKNVKRIKGKNPHHNENSRLNAVEKIEIAGSVLLGHADDNYYWINKFQPDTIGLGYDQKADINDLQKTFPNIKIVRLNALEPEKYKSSLLRIQE